MSEKLPFAVAIDIGGSALKAGLIYRSGELYALRRMPSPSDSAPDDVAIQIRTLIDDICAEAGVQPAALEGVGISIAAFITENGVVTATAHLSRAWIGYDLKARLTPALDTNYFFALDTPAPALGEAYFGAGKGIRHFAYVTVSTGIGAGIVNNGQYFIGGLGWAGGVGHIILDEHSDRVCTGCGNHGCLETFAALQGVIATTREVMMEHPNSRLHAMVRDNGGDVTPRLVYEAAQQGDRAACEVWERVGHALGIGLTALVNIVSPTRVVVGGGITQAGDFLLEPARAVVRERAFPPQHRKSEIVPAALGDLSGLYGAAAMVFHNLRVNPAEEG
jgi:glucokinase